VDDEVPLDRQVSVRLSEYNVAKPGASQPRRPFWRDPVVVIGAAVPTLILTVFFGYLAWPRFLAWRRDTLASAKARAEVEEADLLARQRAAATAAPEPPKKADDPWILAKDMFAAAKLFAFLNLDEALKRKADMDHYKVLNSDISLLAKDPRRIPWLWEYTATVVVTEKTDRSGTVPTTLSMSWVCLIYFPQNARGQECWREITLVRSGQKARRHFEMSEWTNKFRAEVSAAWLGAFQSHELETRGIRSLSDRDRQKNLQRKKESLADEFRISVDELQEILEAG